MRSARASAILDMIMKTFVSASCCLLLGGLLLAPQPSYPAEGVRTCTVSEVLKGGIYVYVRCQEQGKDIWLATVAREFKKDENISFLDVPPLTDFHSKFLNRTFAEIIFTDLLPSGAFKK